MVTHQLGEAPVVRPPYVCREARGRHVRRSEVIEFRAEAHVGGECGKQGRSLAGIQDGGKGDGVKAVVEGKDRLRDGAK